jgi:aminopeptidase N
MKVKKNHIILIFFVIFFLILISVGVGFLILQKYGISFEDGRRFVAHGFSLNPADKDDLDHYISEFQKEIDMIHYMLKIELDTKNELILGDIAITGLPKEKTSEKIILNFNDGFEISELTLNGEKNSYSYEEDKIRIIPNSGIVDTFIINIMYKGKPESLGFGSFNFSENEGKPVVYSLNEPIFASTWFPCNDLPSDKVLTDLFITNDSSMVSISNGVLVGAETNNGKTTYHWKTTYPISTYLISIFSADYEYYQDQYISVNNDTMSIDYFVFVDDLEDAKKDFSIHPTAIKHFAELFGEYPFVKEKYGVAQFLWNIGAMENQTITGIGKNFVTGNQFFTGILVHELAHQWWGNAVTLENWNDIWLNEGFATYSEALYWEKENGPAALRSTMRSFNTNFSGIKLSDPDLLFSRIVYNKGAWVLHMLRRELGDEKFFEILRTYYDTFKYKNASTKDFVEIAESKSNKNLSKFFDQWIYSGVGKIELEYNYQQEFNDSSFVITLDINQVQKEYDKYSFILDFDFYLENETKIRKTVKIDSKKTILKYSLQKNVTKIDLDPDTWLAAEIKFIE